MKSEIVSEMLPKPPDLDVSPKRILLDVADLLSIHIKVHIISNDSSKTSS